LVEHAEAGEPMTNTVYTHPIFFFFLTSISVKFYFAPKKNYEVVKKKPSPQAPFKFITQRIGKWYHLQPPTEKSQSIERETEIWVNGV